MFDMKLSQTHIENKEQCFQIYYSSEYFIIANFDVV